MNRKELMLKNYTNLIKELSRINDNSRINFNDLCKKHGVGKGTIVQILIDLGYIKRINHGVYSWNKSVKVNKTNVLKVIDSVGQYNKNRVRIINVSNQQEQKIGIIRRFIRWIF